MSEKIEFDDLSEAERFEYLKAAFLELIHEKRVPIDVINGDTDTWDNYKPTIERAYNNYMSEDN